MSQNPTSQTLQKGEVTKETHPYLSPQYNPIVMPSGQVIGSPWRQMPKMPGFRSTIFPVVSPWK